MNVKEIISFCNKVEKLAKSGIGQEDYIDEIMEMGDYFNKMGENGKNIVLKKMNEEDFVRVVRAVKATLLTTMIIQGEGTGILMADITDNLDGFTHTMILNVLGILADEEVI